MVALDTPTISSCTFNSSNELMLMIEMDGEVRTVNKGYIRVLYANVPRLHAASESNPTMSNALTDAQIRTIMIDNAPMLTPIESTVEWSGTVTFSDDEEGSEVTGQFHSSNGTVRMLEYRFDLPEDDDGFSTIVTLANSHLVHTNTYTIVQAFVA